MFGTNKNIKILCLLIIIGNRKKREIVSYFQVIISLIVLVLGTSSDGLLKSLQRLYLLLCFGV